MSDGHKQITPGFTANAAKQAPRRTASAKRHVAPLLAIPAACGLAYFGSLEFAAFWLTVTIPALYFAASVENGE